MKKLLLKCMVVLLFVASQVHAQNRTITGTVTGKDDGAPIPGASVTVKGTRTGTQTSIDGRYTITMPAGSNVLVFSFIGLKATEVTIGTSNVVNAVLLTDAHALSEVVVTTGTGTATSKTKTPFAVESIAGSDLPATPTATIDEALVGKIPGAQISSINGTPDARTNILLRGINTLQSATTPMIMLDGVQLGTATDISTLDLSNVDHIEVVQGAASSALYGAQGANGVIQIFTKKGKIGKTRIDVTSSYGIGTLLNNGNVHQANLQSYLSDANGNIVNSAGQPITIAADGSVSGLAWAYGTTTNGVTYVSAQANPNNIVNQPYNSLLPFYDHIKQLFGKAYNSNTTLNISGASDKSDYGIAAAYNKQQDNINGAGDITRYHFSANLGTTLFKGFTVRSTTQLVYTQNNINPNFSTGNSGAIFDALNAAPFFDFNYKQADGTYPYKLNANGLVSVNGYNPFYLEEYQNQVVNTVDIIQNFDANYKVNHFLELDAKYGINYDTNDTHQISYNQTTNLNANDFVAYVGQSATGTGGITTNNNKTTFQNVLVSAFFKTDFQKDFHSKLPITTSTQVQYDFRKNYGTVYNTSGQGVPLTYSIYNATATSSQIINADTKTTFITYGALVNQIIDYGDFGGISGGVRSDYSSAFGSGSKAFTFPHAAAYLRPSSFSFWKDTNLGMILPEVKVRSAFGEAGIQPGAFDRYVTLNSGNLGNSLYFGLPSTSNNAALTPEISKEFEVGTDISVSALKGNWIPSVDLSFTYWTRTGSNVIYPVNEAPSSGIDAIKTNAIGLKSNGIQASLNINGFKSKDFTWNFLTNFSHETSIISSINGPDIILTTSAGSTSLVLTAGQKIGEIYGLKALTSLNYVNQEGVPYIQPSQYGNYSIVNGRVVNNATKGIQFTTESYPLGDPNPIFNMSFINSFSYKKFITFSFQFDWVYGSHLYNQTKEWMYRDGLSGDYTVPVTINGTTAAYEAYYRSAYADEFGAQNGARNSTKDYFYEGSSFLRLRNIALGIDLAKFTNKKIFNRMQVVVSGRNLLTFTKYTGFDPEVSSGTQGSAYDRGVDHDSTPNTKIYQLSLNLGF